MLRMRAVQTLFFTLLMLLLTGCQFSKPLPDPPAEISGSIKIMYFNEYQFMNRYGSMFMAKYPHIDFEVVPLQPLLASISVPGLSNDERLTAYYQYILNEQPDVISGISEVLLKRLIDEGMLYGMDAMLKQHKYDLSTIHPAIIEYIKHLGNGQLYALAPTFHSPPVLMINTDLFEEHGIELPETIASWEELLLLAQRFPTDGDVSKRIFGYTHNDYSSTPYSILMDFTRSMGIEPNIGNKASLDTNGWKFITELVASAFRSGAVQYTEVNNFSYPYREMFKKGRAAMTLGYSSTLQNLQMHFQNGRDNDFHWKIMSLPGESTAQVKNFSLQEVFAVRAASSSIDAAMEFVKFSSGEDVARVHSKNPSVLWSRTTHQITRSEQSLEPFYQLFFEPGIETNSVNIYEHMPGLMEMFNAELDRVIERRQTVDEALAILQTKLQQELDKLESR